MIVKKQGLIQVKIIRNQEKNVDSARIHEIYKNFTYDPVKTAGFLLEAGSQVPAPIYFEQSTWLLKVQKCKKKIVKKKIINLTKY